jgi:CheY-like chemotaxis protein
MSGELILIVEDNEMNMKLMRDWLQVNGYATVESTTAEDGIRLALAQQPALILMDIRLGGMNGIEALAHLRADANTRDIPVIAVTASVMDEEQRQITDAGFDGYQKKPIELEAFLEEVQRVLGQCE